MSSKYIFVTKSFVYVAYIVFLWGELDTSIFGSLFEGGEVFRKIKLNISKGWKKNNIGFKKN